MPSLYGDAMRIVQSPTEVAISYEMLHDTRVIPLDGRAQASTGVRQYMGSSVGRFEGNTLVVETTNFTDELPVGRMPHSEDGRVKRGVGVASRLGEDQTRASYCSRWHSRLGEQDFLLVGLLDYPSRRSAVTGSICNARRAGK
ncbi:MAG TPA: hypothetical protein VLI71_14960 [Gammaproteobacteria bacterium]|nr:hypothetical protein [Gammaproteobacteria bacterium]